MTNNKRETGARKHPKAGTGSKPEPRTIERARKGVRDKEDLARGDLDRTEQDESGRSSRKG